MSQTFSAEILEGSAKAFAAFAANRLLERYPAAESRFAPSAFTGWKSHLEQRIQELVAALEAGEPELFLASVDWTRRAFEARDVPEEDLRASLVCLAEVLEEELPDEARSVVAEMLELAVRSFEREPGRDKPGPDPSSSTGKLALSYLLAILEGDRRKGVSLLMDGIDQGRLTVEQAYLDVLIPAQREVGRLWHADELSVAEEHFVTATTKHVMSLLSERGRSEQANGKTVLAASVAGDVHDIGVRITGDFFEMAGWRVIQVGADLPVAEVIGATERFDADLVVLSATLSTQLRAVERAVRGLRSIHGPKVVVGGLAFNGASDLWKKIGADGYAGSPQEAVRVGERLVGLSG